jgi:hypothetical protein
MADETPEDPIETRLETVAAARHDRQLLLGRRRELEVRITQARGEADAWRDRVSDDRRDVERLQGLTATRVMASLLGSRDDKLAREQAELDAGALRLQEAESRLAAVHREIDHVDGRLAALAGVDDEYAALLDEKERYLHGVGDARAPHLLALAEEWGRRQIEGREVAEALQAVVDADVALHDVERALGSAQNWSTWDLLGGGMISSMVKQSRMDDAAAAARRADEHLLTLRHELADLGADRAAPVLEMTELTRFLDVWFDNVFTDFSVAGRIDRAMGNVGACRARVAQLHRNLDIARATVESRLAGIAQARHDTLTSPR